MGSFRADVPARPGHRPDVPRPTDRHPGADRLCRVRRATAKNVILTVESAYQREDDASTLAVPQCLQPYLPAADSDDLAGLPARRPPAVHGGGLQHRQP